MTKKNFKKEFSDLLGESKAPKKREGAVSEKVKAADTSKIKTMLLSDLTVQTIEKTKAEIDHGLNQKMNVELIAESIESIDLSYLQLLLSINKTYQNKQVSFSFRGEMPGEIRKSLDDAGFSKLV